MSFRIDENQPTDFFRKTNETPARAETPPANDSATLSRRGESDLQANLRKTLIQNSFAPAQKNPFASLNNTTHSILTKTENKILPVAAVQDADETILGQLAETFAKVVNAVFPFVGGGFDTFPPLQPIAVNENLLLGNPSNAVTDVNKPENYLLVKEQYTSSYNRDRGIPNWTSWHLDSGSLGSTKRQNDFRPDDTLPDGWYQVVPNDYTGSGYDRGHLTPSGDRTSSREDNSATFLMTNMIPQASKNNQQTWANLEVYCRELVGQGNELYIIAGGDGTKEFIADGKVAVPEHTWKVILVQPEGTDDISRITAETRVISVYLPNDNNVVSDWRNYTVSTDFVEQQTGFDFFSEIPDEIENQIEAKIDR